MKTVKELEAASKRVIVRVDFNVPLKEGVVTDDTRIQAALPTIKCLKEQGARIILMSHLGRPKGVGYEEAFSLAPVAAYLSKVLGEEVIFATDTIGEDAKEKAAALTNGQILLLENLRFDKREKANDEEFAHELASMADAYVNDAFGTAHRAHASTAGIAAFLPSFAGFLLSREVEMLGGMLDKPERPFVAILGGSKVSDKIQVIDSLLNKCDTLIIGGGMCFTFLAAQGYEVGTSLMEADWIERANETLACAKEKGVNFLLPVDVVCADAFSEEANIITCGIDAIPSNMMGLDVGPKTAECYGEAIDGAATVFWNGPMGVFEMNAFAEGTKAVALRVAANEKACTVIGGGDSVAAVNKFDLADKMTFISTGGGASMELVQGKVLPGIAALN